MSRPALGLCTQAVGSGREAIVVSKDSWTKGQGSIDEAGGSRGYTHQDSTQRTLDHILACELEGANVKAVVASQRWGQRNDPKQQEPRLGMGRGERGRPLGLGTSDEPRNWMLKRSRKWRFAGTSSAGFPLCKAGNVKGEDEILAKAREVLAGCAGVAPSAPVADCPTGPYD